MAVERRAETLLRAGRHGEVAAELAGTAAAHPGREHLTSLLMLALYRSGRQIEALEAFQRHRRRLADELGIEPAEELAALEQAILRHDDALGAPARLAPVGPPRGNVRLPVSTFVGRTDELARTVAALRGAAPVTLTGPGGVGKTRLALQAAAALGAGPPGRRVAGRPRRRDAIRRSSCTRWPSPSPSEIRGTPTRRARCWPRSPTRDRLLLVLDNCEHLLSRCAPLVDRVVRTCPDVRILATSRQPLGVDGEHVLVVAPLPEAEACRLFEDRVRRTGGGRRRPRPAAGARHLPRPRRSPAGAGAGRGPGADARPGRADGPARRAAAVRQPSLRRTGAAADAAGHGGVEPRRCSPRRPSGCSPASGCSRPRCRRPGPPPSAGRTTPRRTWPRSSTSRCWSASRTPAGPRASGCSRRSGCSRSSSWPGPVGRPTPGRRTPATTWSSCGPAGPRLHAPEQEEWIDRIEAEEPNVHGALDWAAEHDPALAVDLATALWPYWDLRWRERFAISYLTRLLDRLGRCDDRGGAGLDADGDGRPRGQPRGGPAGPHVPPSRRSRCSATWGTTAASARRSSRWPAPAGTRAPSTRRIGTGRGARTGRPARRRLARGRGVMTAWAIASRRGAARPRGAAGARGGGRVRGARQPARPDDGPAAPRGDVAAPGDLDGATAAVRGGARGLGGAGRATRGRARADHARRHRPGPGRPRPRGRRSTSAPWAPSRRSGTAGARHPRYKNLAVIASSRGRPRALRRPCSATPSGCARRSATTPDWPSASPGSPTTWRCAAGTRRRRS